MSSNPQIPTEYGRSTTGTFTPIKVFFTDPTSAYRSNGPGEYLIAALQNARVSIDIAVYQLDLWGLRDALISAHRRGINVRIVIESENLDNDDITQIMANGIPILGDRREGLMHNKFVVIDRIETCTGSMNFTFSGVSNNDNNLVCIRSTQMAENYTTEFEEMFVNDLFGPGSPANTPNPMISLSEDANIEIFFSPDDHVLSHLLNIIRSAKRSIHFLSYAFTSDELAQAIIERSAAGIQVIGVLESSQIMSNTGGEYENFLAAGIDVRLDGNPEKMHHKVIIIDENIVITGSYNFSVSAETRNDENTLIIYDKSIALLFLHEFERILSNSRH